MSLLGVIGGSGLYGLELGFEPESSDFVETPWGPTTGPVEISRAGGGVAFLARHGKDHSIAPHRINYRANVHALREAGCDRILAISSAGGIAPNCLPGTLVVPDQLIDYTRGRKSTFQDDGDPVRHLDFTYPYSPEWRGKVVSALGELEIEFVDGGTYAAEEGPRFETAAEIRRLAADGCHLVGMTGMPEAILAREAGLDYAAICPIGNQAAGIAEGELKMGEVVAEVGPLMEHVTRLVTSLS